MQSINKFTEVSDMYKGKFLFTGSSMCHINPTTHSQSHPPLSQPHCARNMGHLHLTYSLTVKIMTACTAPALHLTSEQGEGQNYTQTANPRLARQHPSTFTPRRGRLGNAGEPLQLPVGQLCIC